MKREKVTAFLLAAGVLLLDQVTKVLALRNLSERVPLSVLGDTVQLILRYNYGAAFSLGWGGPHVLLVFNTVASILLAVYMIKTPMPRVTLFLGVILGGALGNLVDRVVHGPVTDFIDIGLGTLRWPVFNVADMAIVVGGALLLFSGRKPSGT